MSSSKWPRFWLTRERLARVPRERHAESRTPASQGVKLRRIDAGPPRRFSAVKARAAGFASKPAWALAGAVALPLALAYLIAAPASGDMAAASYRSYLFAHSGLTLWDNAWYGGHHLPAYSLLAPALGALLGPRLVQAITAPVAAVLFALLIEGRFPARGVRVGACWFAFGVNIELLSGRVPYGLGLAVGLGALLVAQRRRRWAALALAALTSLASPVAGVFLLLACMAWAIGAPARQPGRLAIRRTYASSSSRFIESRGREASPLGIRARVSIGAAALVVILLLAAAFPEGGSEPFVVSSFGPGATLVVLIAALIAREQRVLRSGMLLYALGMLVAFLVPSPLGGNAVRLGALTAGPLAACALWGRRRGVLIALAPVLAYWQVVAPVRDFAAAVADPSVSASYYEPLLGELGRLGVLARADRIEAVATRVHWEARWLAPHISLARGWERQLDREHDSLFYGTATLTSARYHAWLREEGISYVALPDAPLDPSARAEAKLVGERTPTYLREVWRSAHWRLYAVGDSPGLAQSPAVMRSIGSDTFTLAVPRPGRFLVRVRFTGYWAVQSGVGCVQRAADDWTQVSAPRAGELRIGVSFSPTRIFEDGPRCRGAAG